MVPLPRQGRPLPNAEAVLLVRHHQPQALILQAASDQGMGAQDKIRLPRREARGQGPLFLRGMGPGEQGAADPQGLHQGSQALVVLAGQDFCGGHQGGLAAVFHAEIHTGGGHHGLAGAHVSLAQAVHGPPRGHIPQGLLHAAPLGLRQGEGQGVIERLHIHRAEGLHLRRLPPLAQPPEPQGEEEQLLESQPPPGQLQGLVIRREVDVLIGVAHPAELMVPPDPVRQDVRQDVPAGVQSLADRAGEDELADSGGKGVDRDDAPRGLPPSLGLHDGVYHPAAEKVPLRPAIEHVGLPGAEAVFQPGLVEEGHIQGPGLVHRPELHQVQALADVGHRGGRGHHGQGTGGLAGNQVRDAPGLPPVLVPPGKPGDQVPEGADIQLRQGLGPLLADTFDIAHIRFQVRHGTPSSPASPFPLIIPRDGAENKGLPGTSAPKSPSRLQPASFVLTYSKKRNFRPSSSISSPSDTTSQLGSLSRLGKKVSDSCTRVSTRVRYTRRHRESRAA